MLLKSFPVYLTMFGAFGVSDKLVKFSVFVIQQNHGIERMGSGKVGSSAFRDGVGYPHPVAAQIYLSLFAGFRIVNSPEQNSGIGDLKLFPVFQSLECFIGPPTRQETTQTSPLF